MTERECDAIRTALNLMRADLKTLTMLTRGMKKHGFTTEEIEAALTKIMQAADPT